MAASGRMLRPPDMYIWQPGQGGSGRAVAPARDRGPGFPQEGAQDGLALGELTHPPLVPQVLLPGV